MRGNPVFQQITVIPIYITKQTLIAVTKNLKKRKTVTGDILMLYVASVFSHFNLSNMEVSALLFMLVRV